MGRGATHFWVFCFCSLFPLLLLLLLPLLLYFYSFPFSCLTLATDDELKNNSKYMAKKFYFFALLHRFLIAKNHLLAYDGLDIVISALYGGHHPVCRNWKG